MSDTEYAYAVANIRANEHKLFTKADLNSLVSMLSASDVMRFLKERNFGGADSNTEESIIKSQYEKVFSYLKELSENNGIFNVFVMSNDFHNLKAVIKAAVMEKSPDDLLLEPCLIETSLIKSCVHSRDFSYLPEWMRDIASEAFSAAVETGDGQLCDIIVDKGYLEESEKEAKKTKNSFLEGLFQKRIAFYNIKSAVRACKALKSKDFVRNMLVKCDILDIDDLAAAASDMSSLLEYIKGINPDIEKEISGGMSDFEKYCDNAVIEYIDSVRHNAFGIEPLIAYLIYNETEQKNIQIIITGKRVGVPENDIIKRMRRTYV